MDDEKYKVGDIGPNGRRFKRYHKRKSGNITLDWYTSEESYQRSKEKNRLKTASRRAADPEATLKYNQQEWIKKKAFIQEQRKERLRNNPDEIKKVRIEWEQKSGKSFFAKRMLRAAKYRASQKNLEFTLVLEDIHIPDICPVLDIPLDFSRKGSTGGRDSSPSLDKFDPSKGYVKDNIRVISWRANVLKNNGTVEEFEKVIRYLKG